MSIICRILLICLIFSGILAGDSPGGPSGVTLSRDEAVATALRRHPDLIRVRREIQRLEAEASQKGLFPNPELEMEVENIGGTGDYAGSDLREETVVLAQPLPLGGRRSAGKAVAETKVRLAHFDLEAAELDHMAATAGAFLDLLSAQERVRIAGELSALAEELARSVRARVDAGKEAPVEEIRAKVLASTRKVHLREAGRDREEARQRLLNLLALPGDTKVTAVGDLRGFLEEPPDAGGMEGDLQRSPSWQRLVEEEELARRILRERRKERNPELSLSMGWRRFRETGERAYLAGITMEIPLFDRGQGSMAAARIEAEQAGLGGQSSRLALMSEAAVALDAVTTAYASVQDYSETILTGAETALSLVREGYAMGKMDYLTLLDSLRDLFEAREEYLTSLTTCGHALIRLKRITARRDWFLTSPPTEGPAGQGETS